MFKKHIANDIEKVFLNATEFADEVTIDGKKIKVVIDNDARTYQGDKDEMDRGVGNILLFANKETWKSTYNKLPRQFDSLMFNNTVCVVTRITERNGMLQINLDYAN